MAKNTKPPVKKKASAPKKVRKLPASNYKSFRLQKSIKHSKAKLPGSYKLFKSSIRLLINNWKLFGAITLVYLILNVLLVKGFNAGLNIGELKEALQELFAYTGRAAQLTTGVTLFGLLVGSTGSVSSDLAAAYQSVLLVVISLVLIWALRQVMSKEKITVRDAFYRGLYPLVPFLIVLFIIGIQLIPLFVSNFLFGIVFSGGLAVTALEKLLWGAMLFLLIVLSLYMVTSSVFALYIVTLPDMWPMQALRSARELVRYRRWTIMRKVLFLPFILIVISAFITIPLILFLTPIAEWVFFALTTMAFAVVHAYMYSLYRELL